MCPQLWVGCMPCTGCCPAGVPSTQLMKGSGLWPALCSSHLQVRCALLPAFLLSAGCTESSLRPGAPAKCGPGSWHGWETKTPRDGPGAQAWKDPEKAGSLAKGVQQRGLEPKRGG